MRPHRYVTVVSKRVPGIYTRFLVSILGWSLVSPGDPNGFASLSPFASGLVRNYEANAPKVPPSRMGPTPSGSFTLRLLRLGPWDSGYLFSLVGVALPLSELAPYGGVGLGQRVRLPYLFASGRDKIQSLLLGCFTKGS